MSVVSIEQDGSRVKVKFRGGDSVGSQSVESLLLFAMLQELKAINGNIIDVETAVDKIYIDES